LKNEKRGIPNKYLGNYRKHLFITIFIYLSFLFLTFFLISKINFDFSKSKKRMKNNQIKYKEKSKEISYKKKVIITPIKPATVQNKIKTILDGDFTINLGNNIKIKMILIPPSTLRKKYKSVILPFHISKFEITQEIWTKVMRYNNSIFFGKKRPINNITYEEVQDFIKKISKLSKKQLRLPLKDEWEFACRAGSKTIYYWGNFVEENFENYCWYSGNASQKPHVGPQPVGTKKPNNWKLYDMSGNVSEMVETDYNQLYICGGSWISNHQECSSSSSQKITPKLKKSHIGFRLAY